MAPDSAFVSGALKHLVVANRGRWMDPRRTPFHIVSLDLHAGHFVIEIDDFEDRGARLEIPLERVAAYQMAIGSAEASTIDIEQFEQLVARFDRPLILPCTPESTARTERTLLERQVAAMRWFSETLHAHRTEPHVSTYSNGRAGSGELAENLRRFMERQGLLEIEESFATTFVSNPRAEWIKGHRIALAELGLVPYVGSVVRDTGIFDGHWTKERRAEHIISRLSFMRGFFGHVGCREVTLYRGMVFDGWPEPPRNESFVSASFDFDVARSCFGPRELHRTGLLVRQVVPVERLFMTYLETAQLNRQFFEAEAVLLYDAGNPLF